MLQTRLVKLNELKPMIQTVLIKPGDADLMRQAKNMKTQ
jgi:hypothetical protein